MEFSRPQLEEENEGDDPFNDEEDGEIQQEGVIQYYKNGITDNVILEQMSNVPTIYRDEF